MDDGRTVRVDLDQQEASLKSMLRYWERIDKEQARLLNESTAKVMAAQAEHDKLCHEIIEAPGKIASLRAAISKVDKRRRDLVHLPLLNRAQKLWNQIQAAQTND